MKITQDQWDDIEELCLDRMLTVTSSWPGVFPLPTFSEVSKQCQDKIVKDVREIEPALSIEHIKMLCDIFIYFDRTKMYARLATELMDEISVDGDANDPDSKYVLPESAQEN